MEIAILRDGNSTVFKGVGDLLIKYEDVVTYDHLVKSYFHCRKGKSFRLSTIVYHLNYQIRLLILKEELDNGTYVIKDLYSFVIYEPKKRNITANQFEDKIVQRLICEYVLRPAIQPKLIYDNYASQPKKGTHLALHRLQKFMISYVKTVEWTNRGWVLVCDIKKFFYTIDRTICYSQVCELPIDDKLKSLIYDQIFACGTDFNEYTDDPNKGLCIGFQTSQWLAVYYMNGLDHMIKEELHIKYYGRYMDDFYLIHEDREYLEYCYKRINEYVTKVLNLELNKKSHIHPFYQGICFLGYHCNYNPATHKVETEIRSKSIKRMLKRTLKHKNLIEMGVIKTHNADSALQAWHAYAEHGNYNKALNAYDMARNILHPYDYEWHVIDHTQRSPNMVDPDGFIILKYKKKFKDHEGFQRMIPHIETMEECNARLGIVVKEDPPKLKSWKKRKAKVDNTERLLRDSAVGLVYPDNLKKKKNHKKKDEWKELNKYRDKDGFIQLKRKNELIIGLG